MIKIITGFRNEQYYVIEDNEAHKAYYLFNNPEARTTFENGVALIGKNIQGIEPAYNETMGWNPIHVLTTDDWNDIRNKKIDIKLRDVLTNGKRIASLAANDVSLLSKQLSEILLLS